MANQQYMYTLSYGKSVSGMIDAARQYLAAAENMEVQMLNGGSANVTILQARARSGGFKQLVGMDKALTIRFTESGSTATVEFGEAKWGDKAAVMAVSMFILWPLTLTSGYGIYKQKKLPENIRKVLEEYVNA